MATLIAPRWPTWERAVVAPGLSAGLIGATGLVLRIAHVPFSALTIFPFVVVICVAGYLRRRRGQRDAPAGARATTPAIRGVVAAGLLAGVVSAAGLAYSLHAQPLPPDWDPAEHGAIANVIAQNRDVFASVPVPLEHTSYVRPRMAFEASAAVVSELHGPSPAQSMMPLVVVAVLLMPLGLAMLALEATGSYWTAGLTPFLSTGMAFPSFQVILGRFPLVIDASLVAAAVVAMARLVRGRDVFTHATMISAIAAAIWITHGLEALTAVLVGGPLVIELLRRRWSFSALLRVGAGIAAASAGVGLVMALTIVPKAPTVSSGLLELIDSQKSVGLGIPGVDSRTFFEYFAQTDLTSPIAVALFAIGIVAAVGRRQLLWALASLLLLFAVLEDVSYSGLLQSVWLGVVWPWGDVDRLLGVAYWVVPMLMAAGLVWATQLAVRASRDPRTWARCTIAVSVVVAAAIAARNQIAGAWRFEFGDGISLGPFGHTNRLVPLTPWVIPAAAVAAIAAIAWVAFRLAPATTRDQPGWRTLAAPPAVAVLAIVALCSLGIGALQESSTYFYNIRYRQLVTDADVAVMAEMSRTIPARSRVMTDQVWDAGMWVAALTNDTLVVPKPYIGGELSKPLVLALDDACSDPAAAERALASFDAIFIGSHRLPQAPDEWDPKCIGALPGVREIARAGPPGAQAYAYQVIRANG